MEISSASRRRLAATTIAGIGGFTVITLALTLTQSGYDVVRQSLNELALGSGGWLVRAGFCGLGIAAIALAAVLRLTTGARVAPVLLALTGCLQFPMAAFTTVHGDMSTSGKLHATIGLFTLLGNLAAIYASIRPLIRSGRLRVLAVPSAAWAGVATVGLFATSPGLIGDEHFGIGQRVMFALLLSWQVVVAGAVLRQEATSASPGRGRRVGARSAA